MKLHIGDISIDHFGETHSESVKKLNKVKKATIKINFYIYDDDDKGGSKDLEMLEKYKDICENRMPSSIISSKHNYNWVFEGVRLVDFTITNKKRSKFFEGYIVETTLNFEFDSCHGTNDLKSAQRHIQLNSIGL
jgi:hypothetical protein